MLLPYLLSHRSRLAALDQRLAAGEAAGPSPAGDEQEGLQEAGGTGLPPVADGGQAVAALARLSPDQRTQLATALDTAVLQVPLPSSEQDTASTHTC